jgi:glyoxylase-like metal-dependent hydrolase (beta-lactamase superfamily II)
MHVFERGWLSSNNVLFIGADDATLVDSGYVSHAPQTIGMVAHALGGRRLDRILNTHLHSDHCGGNQALQQAYDCAVFVPAKDVALVEAWDEDALSFKATGQRCDRFLAAGGLRVGEELILGDMAWQVLGAPGHDPHSIVLYCPNERLLISADALWENGFGVIFPELDGESAFGEARATLEMLRELEIRLVIPGHGAPFEDAQDAIARALTRLDYLAAEPLRNAQNAVKVLLKFLLLDRVRMPMAEVEHLFATTPLLVAARERYFKQDAKELAHWAALNLRRSGTAKLEDDVLVNRDF